MFDRKDDKILYLRLGELNIGVLHLDFYEFQYALDHLLPYSSENNKNFIPDKSEIAARIVSPDFYRNIKLKPEKMGNIILDSEIAGLTLQLFKGIISGEYDLNWVDEHFYFDIRSFIFFPRTEYFTPEVILHLQSKPYLKFEPYQKKLEEFQGIGYKDFREANREIDSSLVKLSKKLISRYNSPVFIGLAGPTAAGKTEFTEQLKEAVFKSGFKAASLEMDNFFMDRDYREAEGIGSMGSSSLHYDLLVDSLEKLKLGIECEIPQYDFITAKSSHDQNHLLKPEGKTLNLLPADIIYVEGNFPFLYKDVGKYINIKIFYLTDDPVRLKRKWKRDIDYRKKYDPKYLCNRYFRTQFLKASECYLPQLASSDIVADTTLAHIWLSRECEELLIK
ncbi:MAG: hypothetical protein JEY99_01540 [Spirochaetales bacterium]|nr:hypothetical protein [Spirochaetales bacterium]